jgi:hypothetical protein
MKTIVIWYLITLGGASNNDVIYSPPLPDLATCEQLQKNIGEIPAYGKTQYRSRCVKLETVVK